MIYGIYKEIYVTRREPVQIEVTQRSNALPLTFYVKDWEIPDGATAAIYIEKPSGALIFNAAVTDDNCIVADMTTQMTAEPGINKGQIKVIKGESVLHSFLMKIIVHETIINDEAIESTDQFTALEEALAEVQNFVPKSAVEGKGSTKQPIYFTAEGIAALLSAAGAANKGIYINQNGEITVMAHELNSDVPSCPVVESTTPSISSLPINLYDDNVTAKHKPIFFELSNDSAATSDWNITPFNGGYKIEGSISGSTTMKVTFVSPCKQSTARTTQ